MKNKYTMRDANKKIPARKDLIQSASIDEGTFSTNFLKSLFLKFGFGEMRLIMLSTIE